METGRPARETVRAACFAEVDHLRVDGPVRWLRGLVAACMAMLAWPAQAWSEMGHRMVGDLAEWRLSEAARAEVRELLEGEREASLGAVAAWADALRHEDPARFAISRNWHFINAEGGGCGFDEARDCPGGDCIVSAINTQRRILADRSLPRSQRRDALKFIVHLVGDVHQPLHAGSREDRGGNQYQVSLRRGGEGRRGEPVGTNLHTVWDSHVLSSAGLTRVQYVRRLREALPPAAGPVDERAPMMWARESCALVDSERLYPEDHVLGPDYLDAHRRLAEERIKLAAVRLAALLEEVLGEGAGEGAGRSGTEPLAGTSRKPGEPGYSRSRSR
jgi:hypothetical protein|nr:MAG: endonuclease [Pseudomonadota bacterium]